MEMTKMTLKQGLLGAAAIFALLSVTESNAQTTQDINVQADVPSICFVDTTTDTQLIFDLSTLAVAGADFVDTATFRWRCNSATFDITISAGGSTDQLNRAMSGPGGTLAYNLFTDATLTTIWGDGAAGTGVVQETGQDITTVGQTVIHGRILLADAQNANTGLYNDTVTVTMLP